MLACRALRPRRLVRPTLLPNSATGLPPSAIFVVSVPRPFSRTSSRRSQQEPHDRLRQARPLVPHAISNRFTSAGRVRNPRAFIAAVTVAAIAFYLYNSQTVPVTGRRRFNFLSDRFVAWAHSGAAKQIIAQVEAQGGRLLSDRDLRTVLVRRVMKRLIPVSGMGDLDWEIFVIADDRMLLSIP